MDVKQKKRLRQVLSIKHEEKIPAKYLKIVAIHEKRQESSGYMYGLTRADFVTLVSIVDYIEEASAVEPSGKAAEPPASEPEEAPKPKTSAVKKKKVGK